MKKAQGRNEFCRLLVVEDCEDRIALFREWIPEEFRVTFFQLDQARLNRWLDGVREEWEATL